VKNGMTFVLTGAIGAGKSTVGSLLAARGARVIDADRIGHGVIDPSGPAFEAVSDRWPEVVADAKIDRRALGSIVFSDPSALGELERLTHPHIVARLKELVAGPTPGPTVVEVSVPHLPVDERWGRIVVIAADDVRVERLLGRGMSMQEIRQRMAMQPPPEEWLRPGDIVVPNDLGLTELEEAVEQLWDALVTDKDSTRT